MPGAAFSETRGRTIARDRSGGICEVQKPGVCTYRAESMHHRKNRSQGGTWAPSNLLHTCGDGTRGCHGWITEHPEPARGPGWAVLSGWDPAAVAVLYRGELRFLLEDGCLDFVPPEAD